MNNLWHRGTIGIPGADGKQHIARYEVKSYENGSEWGIDGGRISKLWIKIDGKGEVSYDRGWDREAETEIEMAALAILLNSYN